MGARVPGLRIDERIEVRGHTAADVTRLLVDTVVGSGQYRVASVGPNRYHFTRAYRPRWMVPLGIVLTVALFGLGIVLFFIRRTETCSAAVVEGHSGIHVRLDGIMVDAVARRLRDVIGPPPPPPPPPPLPPLPPLLPTSSIPVERAAAEEHVTMVRSRGEGSSLASLVESSLVLVVSDGRRHVLDGVVVIGRDPVPAHTDLGADRLALGADALDISKTHAAVGVDPDGSVWVEDRYSTNGVELVSFTGVSARLVPGQRTPWPAHTTMVLGDLRIELER